MGRVRNVTFDTVRYASRCLAWRLDDRLSRCPSCGSSERTHVASKALITQLVRCEGCRLLYRVPQEPATFAERFYDREYKSGLTTELPDAQTLARMLRCDFRGTGKDLSDKMAGLAALGVETGARVLDFGASWGYGVWQLIAAGYRAEGFELGASRAAWGQRMLGVTIASDPDSLPSHSFDAVFTNHVLEHVRDPKAAFTLIERVLKPGGLLVAFFPNGSDDCRLAYPVRFQCNWGRLHPIYLNDQYCARLLQGRSYWMAAKAYDAPLDLPALAEWNQRQPFVGNMAENEMILVTRF